MVATPQTPKKGTYTNNVVSREEIEARPQGRRGRPPGAKGKKNLAIELAGGVSALETLAKEYESPLQFLARIYSNKKHPILVRTQAAQACLPYWHSKVATKIEVTGEEGGPIEIATADAKTKLSSALLGVVIDGHLEQDLLEDDSE